MAQKHVIQNSPDEVFSVLDAEEIKCTIIDPATILLNDGRGNLDRILSSADIGAKEGVDTARPISSQNASDSDDDDEFSYDDEDDVGDVDFDDDDDGVGGLSDQRETEGVLQNKGPTNGIIAGGETQ